MTKGRLSIFSCSLIAISAQSARAQPRPEPDRGADGAGRGEAALEVEVRGETAEADSASQNASGRRELALRPRLRPADLVEAAAGVFAVQHAGGGKATQYFIRGFDADHGTDLRITVDGVPANMVSHGHGQGYADLNFVIPELVVGVDASKGPYFAEHGDFATAGTIEMKLAEKLDESFAQYSIGPFGIMRGLVVASPPLGSVTRAVVAAEVHKQDGPFLNPEGLHRFNVFGKATRDLGEHTKVALSAMSYSSKWSGSGQIPARAVCGEGEAGARSPAAFGEPCIDRFGFVDPTEGGQTQRHLINLAYATASDTAEFQASVYAMRQRFALYSNFTFFADDPNRGDQIEQTDARTMLGSELRYRKSIGYRGATFTTTIGTQTRLDSIDNALFHAQARERIAPRIQSEISESSIAAYVEERVRVRRWLRFVLGLRADRVDVAVDDALAGPTARGAKASGVEGVTAISPKATAVVSPFAGLDLFANAGRGFHSNDARGAVAARERTALLAGATGYEGGVRVEPARGLSLQAAAFLLDLESELVWVGDAGGTEARGATRRMGFEVSGKHQINTWFFADLAATLVRARFRGAPAGADAVPLAPTHTFSAGLGAQPKLGPFTLLGLLRVKALADRPAVEDRSLTAEGFALVDAGAGIRWRDLEIGVDVDNVFDVTWREVSFANQSRLAYEPAPTTGIHYVPGYPFTAVARATYFWR